MVSEVCKILCPHRCTFQLQQSFILPSCHDDHVVGRPPYFNFSIKHVNNMALLSNVHKKQQVRLQLREIENIISKKIQVSKQFDLDGANSRRFETLSFCKVHYTLYIVIQFLKEVSPKIHVASSK
jgi:hypothetical protein